MQLPIIHTDLGEATLTTDHAASSYGQPVVVDAVGRAYGPGDLLGYIHLRGVRSDYTAEQLAWLDDQIIQTTVAAERHPISEAHWAYGASTKTHGQLVAIERILGQPLARNR